MKFQRLPLDHPASNLWGNVFIGLGSRMNVFQNKLVDKITKYHEIDLELPRKEHCAYFCIISAQDTAYEFLSSLFFSMLFKKLSDICESIYLFLHTANENLWAVVRLLSTSPNL